MAYHEPTDLTKLPTVWHKVSLDKRIATMMNIGQSYPTWAQQAAVAITQIEQGNNVPVNNPAGLMVQGMAFEPQQGNTRGGWGWGRGAWQRAGVRPNGYAMIREGLSGKPAPFFSFASLADSMRFVCQQCYEDGGDHYDGESYCLNWFGIGPGHEMFVFSVADFNKILEMVACVWPTTTPVAGWQDAGVNRP